MHRWSVLYTVTVAYTSFVIAMYSVYSLVPRPYPVFLFLAYGIKKLGVAWG